MTQVVIVASSDRNRSRYICMIVMVVQTMDNREKRTMTLPSMETAWRFMGSYNWGYKFFYMGYNLTMDL